MYLVFCRHALLHFRFHSCCVHLALGPLDSACLELLNKILQSQYLSTFTAKEAPQKSTFENMCLGDLFDPFYLLRIKWFRV